MNLINTTLGFAAIFLAPLVLQYGFNNLATDFISFRKLSYIESFIIVQLFRFILFLGRKIDINEGQEEAKNTTMILAKIIGYLLFWLMFAILVHIK